MNIWQQTIGQLERQIEQLRRKIEADKSFIEDLLKKNKELEHCLKVERDEKKREKQRSGAGRWM